MMPANDSPPVFRNFCASQPVPPANATMAMPPTRMPMYPNRLPQCNFPDAPANYEFNKPDAFYRQFAASQVTPHNKFNKDYAVDNYFPPNQSKVLFNKLLWSNAFNNKPIEKPYDRFPFEMFASGYNEQDMHADTIPTKEIGGIAELERAFGPNADQQPSQLSNVKPKHSTKSDFVQINGPLDNSDCLSEENSDVDCEQL